MANLQSKQGGWGGGDQVVAPTVELYGMCVNGYYVYLSCTLIVLIHLQFLNLKSGINFTLMICINM